MKIKFKPTNKKFHKELSKNVTELLTPKILDHAKKLMKVKFFFYLILFSFFYSLLLIDPISKNITSFTVVYILFGLTGILWAFNSSHDAVHKTLFSNKKHNKIAHYLIFNLQGVNATLWEKRHISSHHIFPNVDGCDVDIDKNDFVRLSTSQERKWHHQFQHIYAPVIYCAYTLHWIFIKDFIYLSKKEIANLKDLSYSITFITEVIILKILYLIIVIFIPYYFSEFSLLQHLIAFIYMHAAISIFFVLTLIISHLTTETSFPIANKDGVLPTCYHEHQLAVSLDYHPTSKIANWIFGGFNSHAAHHLFPKIPHTLYPLITPVINHMATTYAMPYNQLPIVKAIQSHFKYLKILGKKQSL